MVTHSIIAYDLSTRKIVKEDETHQGKLICDVCCERVVVETVCGKKVFIHNYAEKLVNILPRSKL